MPECILCNEEKREDNGSVIEESKWTRELGIPTGFVCEDCSETPDDDFIETPQDISDCKTPKEAAKRTKEILSELVTSEVSVIEDQDGWRVYSSSPFEWAVTLMGGESIFAESGYVPGRGEPEIVGLRDNENWVVSVEKSHVLKFYER